MQVSFNPNQTSSKASFKALSAQEIVKYTSSADMAEKLKNLSNPGTITLDASDIERLTAVYKRLKGSGEKTITFVLERIKALKLV